VSQLKYNFMQRCQFESTPCANELFTDASPEQPSVHAALRDLVLKPEQLEEELNPKPKKK
jgi:hypothetical protein